MHFIRKHIVTLTLGMITLTFLILRLIKEYKINKDMVYVIAVVKKTEWLSNGFAYACEYRYHGTVYKAEFGDIRPKSDSLVFLKISQSDPATWLIVDEHVPHCILPADISEAGYIQMPACKE